MSKRHIPTAEEKRIIRECAQKSARRRKVRIEPGLRYNVKSSRGRHMNVALVSDDPEWNDTDLDVTVSWSEFGKGFWFAEGGRAIVDFWVYSLGRDGELETNVTAYWQDGRMIAVEGTGDGVIWRAAGYTGNPRGAAAEAA